MADDKEKKNGAAAFKSGSSGDSRTKKASASLLARIPKIKATPQSSLGLLGKFKSLAKMDMGMMASAGALVVSLPLAEHFMTKPADQSLMKPGFSTRESGGVDLFEPGTGGYAPGAPGMEEVTPLSARDPASLIDNGEVPAKKPSVVASAAQKVKDAFRETVRAPFKRAAEKAKASMPTTVPPKVQFALKGFDTGGGGSKAGAGLAGRDIAAAADAASRGGATSSMAGVYASGDIRGYGGSGRSVGGRAERLKTIGDSAFARLTSGSATTALSQAKLGVMRVKGAASGSGSTGMMYYQDSKSAPASNSKKSYELQPPEPKEPAEPGSGQQLEPWWKKAKELELQGEIDRQLAEEQNAREEAQANKQFFMTVGNELAQGLIFQPLGMALQGKMMSGLKDKEAAAGGGGSSSGGGTTTEPEANPEAPEANTETPGTETADGSKTESSDSGKTETSDGNKTESADNGNKTESGGDSDGPKTEDADAPKTEPTDGGSSNTANLDLTASRTNGKVEDLDGIEVKTRTSDSEAMWYYKGEMDEVEQKLSSYKEKATQLEQEITTCDAELQSLKARYEACLANPQTAATCQTMLVPPAPCTQAAQLLNVQKQLLAEVKDLEVRVNAGAEGAAGGLSIEKDKIRQKLEELNTKVETDNTEWTSKIEAAKTLVESLKPDFDKADGNCAASVKSGDCVAYRKIMAQMDNPAKQLEFIEDLQARIERLASAMKKTPRPVTQLESGVNKLSELVQGKVAGKESEIQQKIALLEQIQPMTQSIFDYPRRLNDILELEGSASDLSNTDTSNVGRTTKHLVGILRKAAGCRGVAGTCSGSSHLLDENDYWEERHHPTADLKINRAEQALVYNRESPWSLYRLMTLRANLKNQHDPLNKYRVKVGKLVSDMKKNSETLKKVHTTLTKDTVVFSDWTSVGKLK
ncbi:MAG: hypothetical protein GX410_09380 [Elusimicrobia bacterium]|nr:hypothetical protein [Elusimicrobiota bacterium]